MEGSYSSIPRMAILEEKLLVGVHRTMSLVRYPVTALWQSFMPRMKEIGNRASDELLSMSVYDQDYFREFSPESEFDKWAAVEVSATDAVPEGMEAFILPGGLYAVFRYKGSNTDHTVFRYIFEEWLPASGYVPDNRPHFEVLGAGYRNNDSGSEEEIWIPVRQKA